MCSMYCCDSYVCLHAVWMDKCVDARIDSSRDKTHHHWQLLALHLGGLPGLCMKGSVCCMKIWIQQIWKDYGPSCGSKSNTIPMISSWFPQASDHTLMSSFKRPGQDIQAKGLLGHSGEESTNETLLNHDFSGLTSVFWWFLDWPTS